MMIKKWMLAFGIMGTLTAGPALADRTTAQFTSLTVFGDSLVDAGNFYLLSGGMQPNPALGYYQNRFTNGFDYTDLLSKDLFGVETTPSLLGGNNFAVAGARLVDVNDGIPDIEAQINAFKNSRTVDPNGLYVLNFGANDVFAAKGVFDAEGGIGTYADTTTYLQAAVDQYVASIKVLNELGVRNILATDFPLAGDAFTIEANGYLTTALANLTLEPGTDFFFYSLSDFNKRVLTDPDAFGLPQQSLGKSCIELGAQGTGCEGIFSFDGVHPTAAIQEAGYRDMNARFGLTAAVPEPASWLMMIVGFGAIGIALRHRQRVGAIVPA